MLQADVRISESIQLEDFKQPRGFPKKTKKMKCRLRGTTSWWGGAYSNRFCGQL
jgi:hypothetical protein